eukprot:1195495-Prorocentrum_minimum.AAC.2
MERVDSRTEGGDSPAARRACRGRALIDGGFRGTEGVDCGFRDGAGGFRNGGGGFRDGEGGFSDRAGGFGDGEGGLWIQGRSGWIQGRRGWNHLQPVERVEAEP